MHRKTVWKRRISVAVVLGICTIAGYTSLGYCNEDGTGIFSHSGDGAAPCCSRFWTGEGMNGDFRVGVIEKRADLEYFKPYDEANSLTAYFMCLYADSAAPNGQPLPGLAAALLLGSGALLACCRRK